MLHHRRVVFLACFSLAFLLQADELPRKEVTDEMIEATIIRKGMTGSFAGEPFTWLLKQCDYNSNRLCRVAKCVYLAHEDYPTRLFAMRMLDNYGDASHIPFLESCVTNALLGRYAMRVLVRIEGFTTNSINRTSLFHSLTNQEIGATGRQIRSEQSQAICDLLFMARTSSADVAVKNKARDYVYSYVSNHCCYVCTADWALMNYDQTFRNSKRRLALLRYAQPRTSGPLSLQYLADEIQKLEAYPEENLPE